MAQNTSLSEERVSTYSPKATQSTDFCITCTSVQYCNKHEAPKVVF